MKFTNTLFLSFISSVVFTADIYPQDFVKSFNEPSGVSIDNNVTSKKTYDIFYKGNIIQKRFHKSADSESVFPYINNFDTKEDFLKFTVEDTNYDMNTWYHYIHYAMCSTNGYSADDWLFSEALPLKKGYKYQLSFSLQTGSKTESFEVSIGNGASSEEMTLNIFTNTDILTNRDWQEFETSFVAEESGDFYIGFHACSVSGSQMIYLDNIKILEGAAAGSPQTVTNIVITPNEYGELSATVSFDAPLKNMEGEDLLQDEIEKIEVFRKGNLIKTFTNPVPGENCSFEDTGDTYPIENGFNTYQFIAYSDKGKGDVINEEAYIGIDIPVAIENVILQGSEDKAIIAWAAPKKGINGGYVNSNKLQYTITRFSSMGDYVDVAKDLSFSFYEDLLPGDGVQKAYFYGVKSKNVAGESEYGLSDDVLVAGEAYKPSFKEVFSYYDSYAKQNLPALNTAIWVSDENWQLVADDNGVVSKEGGMLAFKPESENKKNNIYTPIIDLLDEVRPYMRLNLYVPENSNAKLDLNYSVYKESNKNRIKSIIDPNNYEIKKGEWNEINIDLTKVAGWNEIRFIFSAEGETDSDVFYIDDVEIYDNIDIDIAVNDITCEKVFVAGQESEIKVYVQNKGMGDSYECNAFLYCDDEVVGTQDIDMLSSNDTCTVIFKYIPSEDDINTAKTFYVEIDIEDDKKVNNKSDNITSFIDYFPFKSVEDLSLSGENDNVILTWSEPVYDKTINTVIYDDIESYDDFLIENIGNYKMVDGDGEQTYGVNMYSWPNIFEPQSFIVFNPYKANMDLELDPGWAPKSGSKMLVCFDVINIDPDTVIRNNDWLITPELKPNTLFSFWAKSPNIYTEPEELEVMYSTTDNDTVNFLRLEPEVIEVPAMWTQYVYVLPSDAKYVALHCISPARFALFIDDLKYTIDEEEQMEIEEYKIYRNGEFIADVPGNKNEYIDKPNVSGNYYYEVEVVYSQGVSDKSNVVEVDYITSIEDVEKEVNVFVVEDVLHIENAVDENISVYLLEGYNIYNGKGDEYEPIRLEHGVYIIRIDEATYKIVI